MLDRFVSGSGKFGQEILEALGIQQKAVSRIQLDVNAAKIVTVTVTSWLEEEEGKKVYNLLTKYQAQLDGDANEANNS